jgi:asparagine synthase (glutamine-hydrolysing)
MCGIAGFRLQTSAGRPLLEAMTETLVHRGPDGDGFYCRDGIGLGHRRLAIVDLATGDQPMANEDGQVLVIFNGEIYNHLDLRAELEAKGHRFATRSDTEVLVHLYEEEGEAFPARLNGIFAFALYDRTRDLLLLARDPLGVKPLYYAEIQGGLLFGSELKALAACPLFPRKLDAIALRAYLTCEYVPAPFTIYRAARKLLPGHVLLSKPGITRVQRYWDWALPAPVPTSFAEAAEVLRGEVYRSVKGQLMSDVPLGVFLSGGVDSSVVAACMARAGGRVESFSIGFEDPSFDESAFARLAAEHLGCRPHEHAFSEAELLAEVPRVLASMDEPFADPSIFPTALLSRFARERVTVALGGDGGDELFAGYPTYWVHRAYHRYTLVPGPLRRAGLNLADRALPVTHANLTFAYKLRKFRDGAEEDMPLRHHLWLGAFTPARLADLMPLAEGHLDLGGDWIPDPPAEDPVTAAQWLDFHTYLVEDILAKVDRASMMASLEARVPLLDPAVVRLAFSIPPGWKLRGREGKVLFKAAFEQDLPRGFLNRPKKGFGIPMARWLCGPLRPMAEELLSDEVLGRVPFLSHELPRRLWREHLERRADHRKPLWTLLTFLDWWRRIEPAV